MNNKQLFFIFNLVFYAGFNFINATGPEGQKDVEEKLFLSPTSKLRLLVKQYQCSGTSSDEVKIDEVKVFIETFIDSFLETHSVKTVEDRKKALQELRNFKGIIKYNLPLDPTFPQNVSNLITEIIELESKIEMLDGVEWDSSAKKYRPYCQIGKPQVFPN